MKIGVTAAAVLTAGAIVTPAPAAGFYGTAGRDVFHGTQAADEMKGYAGNDDLWGHGGQDLLFGGDGADQLTGGPGVDYIDGGPGHDLIYANDKTRETVVCGKGSDTVIADANDNVGASCENVGGVG